MVCPAKDCLREIAEIKALKPHLEHDCFRVLGSWSRPSVKLDQNLDILNKDIASQMTEVQEFGFKIEALCLCYSGHFIGFKVEGYQSDVCIHRNAQVVIKFQDLQLSEYTNHQMNFDELNQEDRLSELKKDAQVNQFKCLVCNPMLPFDSPADICHHLFENKSHRTKLESFREHVFKS